MFMSGDNNEPVPLMICPEVICKNGFLKNVAKLTGKNLCQRLFLNKAACLSYRNLSINSLCKSIDWFLHDRPATLFKKRFWHKCFPVNFMKLSRTPFFYRTPLLRRWWLNSELTQLDIRNDIRKLQTPYKKMI